MYDTNVLQIEVVYIIMLCVKANILVDGHKLASNLQCIAMVELETHGL